MGDREGGVDCGGGFDELSRSLASPRRAGVRRQIVSLQGVIKPTVRRTLQGLLDKLSCLLLRLELSAKFIGLSAVYPEAVLDGAKSEL